MVDIRSIKIMSSSFDLDQTVFQNQSLKKTNSIVFVILALTLLVFADYYCGVLLENEKQKS